MSPIPIAAMAECAVTDDHVRTYQEDGVVHVPGAIPMEWIERLRPGADWCQANPGPYDSNIAPDGAGDFYGGQFMWWRRKEFHDFLMESPAAATVARLMQRDAVQLFYDFILTKEPGAGNPTPWHQDRLYYPVGGGDADDIISIWIALDPVTLKSGAVEYIRGSHKWGKHFGPAAFNGDSRYDNVTVETVPDVEAERAAYDIVSWDLKPGDIVAHHVLVVHGAPENAADIRRRGLAMRWMSGDVHYDPRPGTQPLLRKAFDEGPAEFTPGDRIRHRAFPEFEISAD